MYIEKIILTNFRGASDLTIDLDRHLNVFYGENGAGKSTVLDAAAISLSWLANRIMRAGVSGRPISESDIQNGKRFSDIQLDCKSGDTTIKWGRRKVRKVNSSKSSHNAVNRSRLDDLNDYAEKLRDKITDSHTPVNLPIFVYYPINRAVLDIPLRIRGVHSFDLMDTYEKSLAGGASFRTFFEWFRQREDLENENRRDFYRQMEELNKRTEQGKNNVFDSDSELSAVRHALEQFMPNFKHFRIHRSPLRMEVEKDGELLTVNQLSDGEKCLMAMVGDLARRMAIANPNEGNHLKGEGVVLIDEIDLHLHPKWQRSIITQLQNTFPNCQFIMSTHSPHVLNHVQPENLFVLTQTSENIEVSHPYESYGKDVVSILEDLMGLETTRPLEVQKDLDQLYQVIQRKKLDEAKSIFKKLETDLEEDHDLVTAKILIKRLEDSCE